MLPCIPMILTVQIDTTVHNMGQNGVGKPI